MKHPKQLPYTTDNHEFFISWDKSTATITCKFENEAEALHNPIRLNEFEEMIDTANVKGIKNINFNSNYSIEIMRYHWQEIGKRKGVKITRISH